METAPTRAPSVGDWFVTIFVLGIPLVGLIFYLYWAFADGVNEAKRNFCRAGLLWTLVAIAFFGVLALLGGFATLMSGGDMNSI